MKLNDNGDFCLLYIEPEDEKQSLFETIGAQTRPVVLMLLLTPGHSRTRLFQRPEDFSDLKHVRRQTGVSVIFVTSGSERLAQLAARYGFPSYPSIDAFANFLTYGYCPESEEGESQAYPYAQRRARTGPLVPSAMQLAALRRAIPTGPLHMSAQAQSWPDFEREALPIKQAVPLAAGASAPFSPPLDLAFWPVSQRNTPPELAPSIKDPVTPLPETVSMYHTSPLATRDDGDIPEEDVPYESEIPPRRSALLPHEQYTRHPGWEQPEHLLDDAPIPHLTRARSASSRSTSDLFAPSPASGARSSPDLPPVLAQPVAPRLSPPVQPSVQKRWGLVVLLLLSLLILGGAGLGSFIVISHTAPVVPVVAASVGSITFVNSEQLNKNTSQGIDDQVQLALHNLGTPASGKSYYAWLLGDQDLAESQSILLGKLTVKNGTANLFYRGDAQHTNLLQITSRFLITEEESAPQPLLPSPDTSTWRYYGALPAQPDPNDAHHFAFLNHLRHLLADEPILDEMELPGGLNNWFTRNTQKLIEWTSSARDHWQESPTHNIGIVRSRAVSILSYLDGMSFMAFDIPPASAKVQVTLDTHLAGLGLLNVRGPNQKPPSYMDQIVYHLNGLINAPGSPANVRTVASTLLPAMNDVAAWLQNLRSDDKKILAMSDAQLGQQAAFSLLDDMVLQASNAYSGNSDPSTNQLKQGVVWIHQQLQSIATINISSYTHGPSMPEVGPASSQHAPSSVLELLTAWRRL
ncbi:MAG TPA: hypothetical protein VFV38_14855 [Ktedonobacteraceae bacterium]|nr:hypothetical protein [Ktedonobacteraceae bacterium]